MSTILQTYHQCVKGQISDIDYIFDITESKIKMDDGSMVELWPWQNEMLKELVNFAYHNQNKVIYQDTALSKNRFENGFCYNMVALYNGEIYLLNISTNTSRLIEYKFREKSRDTLLNRWGTDERL